MFERKGLVYLEDISPISSPLKWTTDTSGATGY
jgi:hypothetical protein